MAVSSEKPAGGGSMRIIWVLCALLVAAAADADPAYKIVQDVPLAGGRLQILEDARLGAGLEKQLWATCVDPLFVLGDDDPAAQPFRTQPLAPAKLRQLDAKGAVVLDIVLQDNAPIARIEPQRIGATLMIRADDTACMGTYTGQAITFHNLAGGRLIPAMATDAAGKSSAVRVLESDKTGWRFVRRAPNDIVIEALWCRPDFEAEKRDPKHETHFQMRYITYRYDGHTWRFAEHDRPGFWESEDGLPAHSRFPKVE